MIMTIMVRIDSTAKKSMSAFNSSLRKTPVQIEIAHGGPRLVLRKINSVARGGQRTS